MSRLYIRVMTGFYSHRKTARLRAMLGDDAFWIPPRLWAYAAENQPDGDLSGYNAEELAMLLGYNKDATSMLVALTSCGFVDSDMKIHGWMEHNGYHDKFAKRAKAAAQARWAKEKSPKPPKEVLKEESGKGKGETSIACSMLVASDKHESRRKPTLEEVKFTCQKAMIPESDAIWFWNKCEGNGWTNGGKPIKSYPHTLAAWKAAGYLPSQKNGQQKTKRNAIAV